MNATAATGRGCDDEGPGGLVEDAAGGGADEEEADGDHDDPGTHEERIDRGVGGPVRGLISHGRSAPRPPAA